MEKTLYVTDLDGTLLDNETGLSPYTVDTINAFLARGGLFTYATARSHLSAHRLTAALDLHLPVITYNGTFISDAKTGALHHRCTLAPDAAARIILRLTDAGACPIVYAFIDGQERFSWIEGRETKGVLNYVSEKTKDRRRRPVPDPAGLLAGDVFYITVIDTQAEALALAPLFAAEEAVRVHTLRDSYRPEEYWLELSPKDGGKDKAILRLREMLGATRVVCFGDNLNDLAMFRCADEAYAVANALPAVQEAATAVIGANEADGVARHLASLG